VNVSTVIVDVNVNMNWIVLLKWDLKQEWIHLIISII